MKYRQEALRLAHIAPLAGHFGASKTVLRLSARFFWPGMTKEAKEMCKCCPICQKRKSARAPLVALPIIRRPFKKIAMDMIGPLPTTSEGYKHILTICDYKTRRFHSGLRRGKTWHGPCRSSYAEWVFRRRPRNQFLLQPLYRMLGIKAIKTAAYHPQTDGMVERYNGTLKTGIKRFIDQFPVEWNKSLPFSIKKPHTLQRDLPHSS